MTIHLLLGPSYTWFEVEHGLKCEIVNKLFSEQTIHRGEEVADKHKSALINADGLSPDFHEDLL